MVGCARHAPTIELPSGGPPPPHPVASVGAVLEEAASDEDVEVRQRARHLQVRHAPPAWRGALAAAGLADPSPYVQRSTAAALLEAGLDEAARELLVAFVQREDVDPYTRGQVAVALGLRGIVDPVDALARAAVGEGPNWERAPLALGAALMGDRATLGVVDEALRRGDLPLEVAFLLDCGRSGFAELREPLAASLHRTEDALALAAAAALVALEDPRGAEVLEAALAGPDVERAWEAIDHLVEVGGPGALGILRRATRRGGPVGRFAELARVALDDARPEVALRVLAGPDRDLRVQAAWSLGRWLAAAPGDAVAVSRVEEALRAALDDAEYAVVVAALRALGAAHERASARAVLVRLRDELVTIRVEAAGAALGQGLGFDALPPRRAAP